MPDPSIEAPPRNVSPPPSPPEVSAPISYAKLLGSLVLSIGVLAVIGAFTFEPEEFALIARRVNPWLMAAAVGCLVPRILFGGWRLSYVSRGRLSLVQGVRGQLAWDFFSNVTPSAIGGGPIATVYIARDARISVGESSAIMLFSMLLDQFFLACTIPLLLLAATHFAVFPASLGAVGTGSFLALFGGMLLWVVFFGYTVLFRPDLLQRLSDGVFKLRWLRRFRPWAQREAHLLRRHAEVLRAQPFRFYAVGFLLTTLTWAGRLLLPVFIVWSIYAQADRLLLLLRTAAMSFGAIILPTPGGAGGIEGLYYLFFRGLMPDAALAPTLLLWRMLGYYLFLALGTYIMLHRVRPRSNGVSKAGGP